MEGELQAVVALDALRERIRILGSEAFVAGETARMLELQVIYQDLEAIRSLICESHITAPQPSVEKAVVVEDPVEQVLAEVEVVKETEVVPERPPVPEVKVEEVPPTAAKAEPTPKPSIKRPDRTSFTRRRSEFSDSVRRFENGSIEPDRAGTLALQGWVCEGRSLEKLSEMLDEPTDHLVDDYRRISVASENENPNFFGHKVSRVHDAEEWAAFSIAYRNASKVRSWLDYENAREKPAEAKTLERLLQGAAASVQYLLGLCAAHNITEPLAAEMRSELVSIGKDRNIHIKYLQGTRPLEDHLSEAEKFSERFERRREHQQKEDDKSKALADLGAIVEDHLNDSDFDGRMLAAVRDCLKVAVPPSNKDLVAMVFPHLHVLVESKDKQLALVVRACEAVISSKKKFESIMKGPVKENYVDPETTKKRSQLRKRTKGKVALMIGGHRPDPERIADLEKALELKELIWPDTDPSTKVAKLAAHLSKSDLVCLAVRFSRHSYKDVLDEAKGQGKMTAVLRAGLGEHRIINDLFEQLIRPNSLAQA